MIASAQITNTEIFAFRAVLVFKLLSHNVLFTNRKDKLQNYKWFECEIFRALLKHFSDHLSVLFQFA